jgi:hypothetical protein
MAENKGIVREEIEPEKRAIALTWLFHLVGTFTSHFTRPAIRARISN